MDSLSHRTAQDAVELELIRSLAASLVPALIMTTGFTLAGGLIVWTARDATLLGLLLFGMVVSVARIAAALRLPRKRGIDVPIARARRRERQFRIVYLTFAATLGLFGLRTFMLDSPQIHMLMVCLLIGYAAGVAATVALRPSIAIPSMLMALSPMILSALFTFQPLYVATGLMTAAFLVGGVQNLRVRHSHTVDEIAQRITFGNIARKDSLTALPNRIALREWFQDRRRTAADGLIAVHYLDLDGFKPINDRFGHPIGDALLTAVGERIANAIREGDLAARLGGDEFAIVQYGIESAANAEHLAQRLNETIGRPYRIESRAMTISTSIGYVVVEPSRADLEELLNLADQALYRSKRQGGGVTRHRAEHGSAKDAA